MLENMNLNDLFKSMPTTTGVNQSADLEVGHGSNRLDLKHQAGLTMAKGVRARTMEEVWREIQQEEKMKMEAETNGVVVKAESESTVVQMTLEDFLVKAGAFDGSSSSPVKALDAGSSLTPQSFSQQVVLSSAPLLRVLSSDTPISGSKRDVPDSMERSIERKLRRKIKNRESAARSRARKQAYQNELAGKVSHLEAENIRLKREKDLEKMFFTELSEKMRYQLRRTSSASF